MGVVRRSIVRQMERMILKDLKLDKHGKISSISGLLDKYEELEKNYTDEARRLVEQSNSVYPEDADWTIDEVQSQHF